MVLADSLHRAERAARHQTQEERRGEERMSEGWRKSQAKKPSA
jgi:hypothetical protein